MRRRTILLATASLVYASQSVFSVHDDLLAFPQYEVVFSDSFISETDAESRLAYAASSSSARAKSTPETPTPDQDTSADLAHRDGSSSSPPNSQDPNPADTTDTYETMILNDKRYLCTIPRAQPRPQNETSKPTPKADDDEQELARASDRGWELLKDMQGHCLYFISGWWSYSFCYNTQVKQFHQLPPTKGAPPYPPVEDPNTPSYILGQFPPPDPPPSTQHRLNNGDSATPPPPLENALSQSRRPPAGTTSLHTKASKRYLAQSLSHGSTCDLTGRPRRIEIQFHCHPQSPDRIAWIKEVTTCAYVMVVYTPRLCNDLAFLPPRELAACTIACREVVREGEEAKSGVWEAAAAAAAAAEMEMEMEARVQVGGIVVGGMRHVGSEGRRLSPPPAPAATAAPLDAAAGKGELVAKMRPGEEGGRVQKLRDQEIREMGFEPREVDALLRELQGMAEGNGWRVELVEVRGEGGGRGGRELRGVVEVEGEGEGEEEGGGGWEDVGGEGDGDDGEGEDGKEGLGGKGEGRGKRSEKGSEEVYKDEL